MQKKQYYCRYCGERIIGEHKRIYCCDEHRQAWHYEEQDRLRETPGVKKEYCVVCGLHINKNYIKYCSRACYIKDRYYPKKNLKKFHLDMIRPEEIKSVKRIKD